MSLINKKKKDTFKDLLYLNNSNTGLPATTPNIVQDGNGGNSALQISKDKIIMRPSANDSTDAITAKIKDGTTVFAVDSTNKGVKVNQTQDFANTQYIIFRCYQLNAVANTWYAIPFDGGIITSVDDNFGTDAAPATSFTATYTALNKYWYVHDNITIDAIKVIHMGDDSASTDTLQYSLNSFTLDSSGAGSGDLSAGAVVASSSSQTIDNADADVHSMTIGSPDVTAGKVLLMCVRGGATINNDITASVYIKYHIT